MDKTLRDEIAMAAMQALLSTGENYSDDAGDGWNWFARSAYAMADEMLAERARVAATKLAA